MSPPKSQEEINALIAKKRAEVMARIATMKLPNKQQEQELHPMLRGDYKSLTASKRKPNMTPVSSVKANQRKEKSKRLKIEHEVPASFTDPSKNPYFDPSLGVAATRRTALPHQRKAGKRFQFFNPGTFVARAEKLRDVAKAEELRVEEKERAAREQEEMEARGEEYIDIDVIRSSEPPTVEWWDKPFLTGGSYDMLDDESKVAAKLDAKDSLVSIYIQHPVPIDPPAPIKNAGSAPSQLILTRKERKKIRRQRRMEQQREHREKVMLGLLPPEEPKLRLSNFMQIMANQSVPDPTKLEAEVRKQMQARLDKHQADNQTRKLTREQKQEKVQTKLETEEKKGITTAVFKVGVLKHPQHKYKVSVNAKQMHLTGAALVCDNMSVVIVEGPDKYIKQYKKVMLRRIDWANRKDRIEDEEEEDSDEQMSGGEGGDNGNLDYSGNECHLVWEGETGYRKFTGFRIRDCPTETQANNWLAGAGCEQYWKLAKQFKADGDDILDMLPPV